MPDDAPDVAGRVLYLVISGAPAPEGITGLVGMLRAAGWQVVVFSTPLGIWLVDAVELEDLTGQPVRSEYRMPGVGAPVTPADVVLASADVQLGEQVRARPRG